MATCEPSGGTLPGSKWLSSSAAITKCISFSSRGARRAHQWRARPAKTASCELATKSRATISRGCCVAKGDAIPDDHHVLLHVPPSKIEQDGRINGAAFKRREDEAGLSVEWREALGNDPVADQLQAIRAAFRRQLRPSHRFAELPVGVTREHVRVHAAALSMAVDLAFEHEPREAGDGRPADPFHSEIFGTPENAHLQATAIGDLIAECISERYPAVV